MDSPVRKAQKRNDYLRHKLFRKIKRRQRNKIEQDSKIAEKELKRRLRRPKFDGGKKAGIDVTYRDAADAYDYLNSHPDASVVLDEQSVVGHAPNARQRLAKYLENAPARYIDRVMLGYLAAGIAPVAMQAAAPGMIAASDAIGGSTAGQVATKALTSPIGKPMVYGTAGATGADIAAKSVTGKTFEEWGEQDLGLPWYLSGFVNPGGYLAPTSGIRNMLKRPSIPQITAENAANYPGIMADVEDFSYKGLTYDKDLFTKLMYNNKIHGKPMFPSDEGPAGFSKSVQIGIPKIERDELLHDVIGRNIREFKRAGLSDTQISKYINNAKDAMDNVRIGMYSNSDYIKGGWEGFGGFYDSEGNFISVNTGSPLTRPKIVKHEGRHLLDHKVDDEILMPTSENFGKDFDSDMAFSTMQKVKQNQNMILHDAYDNDFVTLPSKEGFNEGLEGYSNMDREAITTNLDSRNELLGSKAGWDLDITDKIIDKMPDNAIFEAVEKANGYGRRFIKFLKENNKLTPQKAQQFREAMKHVGAYIAPTFGVGAAEYGVEQYNSGKDIHIKPSRRGTFTAAAKKHGMSVQAYARKVLKAPKGKYSSAMRKKANFARVFGGRNY